MRVLEVIKGAEEASLDARYVLLREVGVVLGGDVWVPPRQCHQAGCNHVRAKLYGAGPMRFQGASLCWGRSVTFHLHRSAGMSEVHWVHSARQYIALPRFWLRLLMKSSVSRDLRSHVPQIWGSSGSSSLVYVSGPKSCVGGGSVFGGEEGVGAVYQPGASWCVVMGGGEGVVYVVHEGHVRGGGLLLIVGGRDISGDVCS